MSSRMTEGAKLPDGRYARAGVFVYLASRSPRRQELLRQIGVAFQLFQMREAIGRSADVDESVHGGESAIDYVRRVAEIKASTGWLRMSQRRMPEHPMVGADTSVVVEDRILGKPADDADARRMLRLLSGRTHRVHSAVSVAWQDQLAVAVSESRVAFRSLTDAEIDRYVATGEPIGKAGAYGIQGRAAVFVTRLDGSFSGVMGLPLAETAELLGRLGFPVL